jgi:molybdenum cofactor cytidylyltransferase
LKGTSALNKKPPKFKITGKLTSDIINKIIHTYKGNKKGIIVPLYDGKRGNPVLFSVKYREQLLSLEGDIGGRKIIQNEMENVCFENIYDKAAGLDIDTWEEYLNYVNLEK